MLLTTQNSIARLTINMLENHQSDIGRLVKGVTKNTTKIKLDKLIATHIPQWKQDPGTFFCIQHDGKQLPFGAYLTSLVQGTTHNQDNLTAIQRRLGLVGIKLLTSMLGNNLAGYLNCSYDQVTQWVNIGRRYEFFMRDFENHDVLIVIPGDISRSTLVFGLLDEVRG